METGRFIFFKKRNGEKWENGKIIKIRPRLNVAIERQNFTTKHAYLTKVKTLN